MRRALLICGVMLYSVFAMAQDFTSLFLGDRKADPNLNCVTISPKMMEEILERNAGKDENMLEIISNLKSMQILSASVNSDTYYKEALNVIEKNSRRFEPFLSYEDGDENCQIVIRKKGSTIVELVMLVAEKNHFSIINFTGKIKPEFILTLAKSVTRKGS